MYKNDFAPVLMIAASFGLFSATAPFSPLMSGPDWLMVGLGILGMGVGSFLMLQNLFGSAPPQPARVRVTVRPGSGHQDATRNHGRLNC